MRARTARASASRQERGRDRRAPLRPHAGPDALPREGRRDLHLDRRRALRPRRADGQGAGALGRAGPERHARRAGRVDVVADPGRHSYRRRRHPGSLRAADGEPRPGGRRELPQGLLSRAGDRRAHANIAACSSGAWRGCTSRARRARWRAQSVYSAAFGDQAAGTIANVAPAPGGGFDALVVAQVESLAGGDLRWNSPDGAPLEVRARPYAPEPSAPSLDRA